MIRSPTIVIITFECIAVNEPDFSIFIDRYTAAALSALAVLIFSIHDFLTEIAFIDVKICRVHSYQPREKDIFDLFSLWMLLCGLG